MVREKYTLAYRKDILSYAQTYLGHKQQELQTLWESKTRITTSDIP